MSRVRAFVNPKLLQRALLPGLLLISLVLPGVAVAQPYQQAYPGAQHPGYGRVLPPVDLPIRNIPQETQVWCWAAVAQQIIMATHGPQRTPAQCELVASAYGQHPQSCCGNPRNCTVTGSLAQIQGLIAHFGGRHSSLEPPTDPMTLYRTLADGKAVVLAVKATPFSGHVIVLRGMGWMPTPNGQQPVLFINDPMAYFTAPVPFAQIARYWESAIVVN